MLGPAVPLADPSAFRPGIDGLIVERGLRRGLLLPEVATDQGWGAREMLAATCWKAGLPMNTWRDPETRVLAFRTARIGEADASDGAAPGRMRGGVPYVASTPSLGTTGEHDAHVPADPLARARGSLIVATVLLATCGSSASELVGPRWQLTAITEKVPAYQGVVPASEQAKFTITFRDDDTFESRRTATWPQAPTVPPRPAA